MERAEIIVTGSNPSDLFLLSNLHFAPANHPEQYAKLMELPAKCPVSRILKSEIDNLNLNLTPALEG